MPPIGYVSQGRPARVAGEVSWEVRKIEGLVGLSGCAKALRIAVVSGLTLLVLLPAGASAASTAEVVNTGNGPFLRVNGDGADNEITADPDRGHLHGYGHHRRVRPAPVAPRSGPT